MKKALHENQKSYLTAQDGELHVWYAKDVDILIRSANNARFYELMDKQGVQFLTKDGDPDISIPFLNAYSNLVNDWMREIVDEGISDEFIDKLNGLLSKIRYIQLLLPAQDGRPFWQIHIADMNRKLSVVEVAAFTFSNHLALGSLDGLKRCEQSECQNYYIGRSDSKWCSKSCGSKHRVRLKRKRDK